MISSFNIDNVTAMQRSTQIVSALPDIPWSREEHAAAWRCVLVSIASFLQNDPSSSRGQVTEGAGLMTATMARDFLSDMGDASRWLT